MVDLKTPWLDRDRCKREPDCRASKYCRQGAFKVHPEPGDEPGKAAGFPLIDLEACKRCGDCEHACPEGAVRMV